ncbi:MAG: hypothetical protein Q7T18_09750, partial [Sedimentisphaerales bacterium]|nr:hypothetical protein [Sedimentisphaerales bacterium]
MTLVELIVGMAIMVVAVAALAPMFHCIQNSWAYKQSSSETLQNGRVLVDHIVANLSQATRITSVSASTVNSGFITYLNDAGTTMRYDISPSGYAEYGAVGSLSQLAGPATRLRFTCYDINNPGIAITDPNKIRIVAIEAIISDATDSSFTQTFTGKALIRSNASSTSYSLGTKLIYDASVGIDPALCSIDGTRFLCAYQGASADGWAAVLSVNTATAVVTRLSSYEFDTANGKTPALAQIDSTHYLCAYDGTNNDGWSVILQVNPFTWAITKGTPFEYDTSNGQQPALAQIDATRYLCVYKGVNSNGYAVILTVNTGAGTITKGTAFEFDTQNCVDPALAKIDATHYLCVYTGQNSDGFGAMLVPNIGAGTITKAASLEFDTTNCTYASLAQVDATHYL